MWVKCITVFRLTWKVLSYSRRPNVLIYVKATYTAFHHVRLHYFCTKWILWCKKWRICREHDMHMNCIAGKMKPQFIKETKLKFCQLLVLANRQTLASPKFVIIRYFDYPCGTYRLDSDQAKITISNFWSWIWTWLAWNWFLRNCFNERFTPISSGCSW